MGVAEDDSRAQGVGSCAGVVVGAGDADDACAAMICDALAMMWSGVE